MIDRNTFTEIENQIASLAPVIQPSDCARENTLERASESSTRHQAQKQTLRSVIVASALIVALSPLLGALTRVEVPHSPSASDIHSSALDDARIKGQSTGWSLADLIYKTRTRNR